jgi:tripartite-type tricarboxylate transporter receptor subunit TctC
MACRLLSPCWLLTRALEAPASDREGKIGPMQKTARRDLLIRIAGASALAIPLALPARAADPFPTRPVRVIVTSAPGGWIDVTTRIVAQRMSDHLGQQVVVENRTGAGGVVAIRSMRSVPADGYTLLAVVNTVAIQQFVSRDSGYDVARDFTGVGPMARVPFLLVQSPNRPDRTLGDLLMRVREAPRSVTYASAGNGSTTHLAGALFAQRAGIELLHVPYRGNAAAWPDVISQRVGLIFEPYGTAVQMLRDGQLRALGVSSRQRLEVLPELPTIAEQGVPTYDFYLWSGILAPTGTPQDVVQKLNTAMLASLATPELRDRFRNEGAEVTPMAPDAFTRFVADEVAAMRAVVPSLGLATD